MLFIKEDSMTAIPINMTKNWNSLLAIFCKRLPIFPINPDASKPLLINKTSATVMTAGCPNPTNASLAGTKPRTTKTARLVNATASYRNLPQINITTITKSTAERMIWLISIKEKILYIKLF